MHGTNAGQVPMSSTAGPFCPGGREAPSGSNREPAKVPPCTTPNPLCHISKRLLAYRQDPPVTHSLPLTRHEERFKFIQGFSAAPCLCPPRERRVPRPFFAWRISAPMTQPCRHQRVSLCGLQNASWALAHLEPSAPREGSVMNGPIV